MSEPRRIAREIALQVLYGTEVGNRDPNALLGEMLGDVETSQGRIFIKDLVHGALSHAAESDAAIAPLLEGWTIDRLATIDRLILRMAMYELRHVPDTPLAVAINEAVELAKRFSTEDASRFVNGVLSRAARVA